MKQRTGYVGVGHLSDQDPRVQRAGSQTSGATRVGMSAVDRAYASQDIDLFAGVASAYAISPGDCSRARPAEMDAGLARRNPVLLGYFGEEGAARHVAMLLAMTACYLAAAAWLIRHREFTFAAESET